MQIFGAISISRVRLERGDAIRRIAVNIKSGENDVPYNQKAGITRIIKGALPSATRETLVVLATTLAERSEWNEDRNRLLVGLHDIGIVSERFADDQATATKERNKKRDKATGVGEARTPDSDTTGITATDAGDAPEKAAAARAMPQHGLSENESDSARDEDPDHQDDPASFGDRGGADHDGRDLHHHVDTHDYRDGHA